MGIRADLHHRIDDALAAETRLALVALRQLLDEDLPWLERHVVGSARRSGYSWQRIGRVLGRSRQSLHARFRDNDIAWRAPTAPGNAIDRLATESERRFDASLRRERFREELARWDESGDDVVPW